MVSVQMLITAALAGAVGSVLTAWLRNRHEREEAFRGRQIEAADDLSTGLLQAIIGLSSTYKTILDNGFLDTHDPPRFTIRQPPTGEIPDVITASIQRARELAMEAHARQARVALLFGPVSPADRAATLTLHALNDAIDALEDRPVPDLNKNRADRALAGRHHAEFNERVVREIRVCPWYERRVVRWTQRRWRSWRSRRELPDGQAISA